MFFKKAVLLALAALCAAPEAHAGGCNSAYYRTFTREKKHLVERLYNGGMGLAAIGALLEIPAPNPVGGVIFAGGLGLLAASGMSKATPHRAESALELINQAAYDGSAGYVPAELLDTVVSGIQLKDSKVSRETIAAIITEGNEKEVFCRKPTHLASVEEINAYVHYKLKLRYDRVRDRIGLERFDEVFDSNEGRGYADRSHRMAERREAKNVSGQNSGETDARPSVAAPVQPAR